MTRVSFDLDGTVFAHPQAFLKLFEGFRELGVEIGVLSARKVEQASEIRALLRQQGFPEFDFMFLEPAWYTLGGCNRKSSVIREEVIDLHFDDEPPSKFSEDIRNRIVWVGGFDAA